MERPKRLLVCRLLMSPMRRATPEDNAALLELFGAVPMPGELVLSTQRAPDYFALFGLQRGTTEVWVHEESGRLDGMGAIHVREGWLDGQPCRVGYLGDLRAHFSARRSRGLARFYGPILEEAAERHGVSAFLTAVMATNSAALQALVRRKASRASQPHYCAAAPLLQRVRAVRAAAQAPPRPLHRAAAPCPQMCPRWPHCWTRTIARARLATATTWGS